MLNPYYLDNIGNTPIIKLPIKNQNNINVYTKLEYHNPTGSVKDRAAFYILNFLLNNHQINKNTVIIESSSGNFGVALSAYCKKFGLKFIGVIDLHTTQMNEMLMKSFGATLIKITERDKYGGCLLNRIKKVKELKEKYKNSYWINQYANHLNAQAYYNTLGLEICNQIHKIDYLFLGVSSGGTISGVSKRIKEEHNNATIVAVDIEGSVIFGGEPKKRCIPGIGSSMVPEILKQAKIDDVMIVSEKETIAMCNTLLKEHSIFVGGSSGSVFSAICKYFKNNNTTSKPLNVVTIFPDKGERYSNTIYSQEWYNRNYN